MKARLFGQLRSLIQHNPNADRLFGLLLRCALHDQDWFEGEVAPYVQSFELGLLSFSVDMADLVESFDRLEYLFGTNTRIHLVINRFNADERTDLDEIEHLRDTPLRIESVEFACDPYLCSGRTLLSFDASWSHMLSCLSTWTHLERVDGIGCTGPSLMCLSPLSLKHIGLDRVYFERDWYTELLNVLSQGGSLVLDAVKMDMRQRVRLLSHVETLKCVDLLGDHGFVQCHQPIKTRHLSLVGNHGIMSLLRCFEFHEPVLEQLSVLSIFRDDAFWSPQLFAALKHVHTLELHYLLLSEHVIEMMSRDDVLPNLRSLSIFKGEVHKEAHQWSIGDHGYRQLVTSGVLDQLEHFELHDRVR